MSTPVIARRLAVQKLARQRRETPASIVSWFGAVQAQEYGPARWALGQRTTGLSDAAVARAFDAGEILRTHVMRATWHFVAPEDIRWLQALTGPRVRAASASVLGANALDARTLARSKDVIARALEGGNFLTRQELAAVLGRARIAASGQRLAYIVMDAELEAVICSGPRRGKQFTYALVDERAPRTPPRDRDDALAELARRFFQSHGPATLRDFVWWSSLRMNDARTAVAAAALSKLDAGGTTYWMMPGTASRARSGSSAHLLPIYDEYVNSYRDRAILFTTHVPASILFMHYLIVDGRYAGTWRPSPQDPGAVVIDPRVRLTSAQHDAIDKAAARYRRFVTAP